MVCKIIRWFIGCSVDGGRSPGRLAAAHLRRCRECRRYYNEQVMVDRLLTRSETPYQKPDPTAYRAIMRALPERDTAGQHRQPRLSKQKKWAIATVLLFAGSGLAGLFISGRTTPDPPAPEPAASPVFPVAWTQAGGTVKDMIDRYSLEKEIQNTTSDLSVAAKVAAEYADSLLLFGRRTDNDDVQ